MMSIDRYRREFRGGHSLEMEESRESVDQRCRGGGAVRCRKRAVRGW
jgi:hypothetical protein